MQNEEHAGQHEHDQGEQLVADERIVIVEEVVTPSGGVDILEEIIDIEIYAKERKKPPHARGYRIRIDKEYRVVHVPEMTGRDILALVAKTPEGYQLSQKMHDGSFVPITADEKVDFRRHGIERFQTVALDATEG